MDKFVFHGTFAPCLFPFGAPDGADGFYIACIGNEIALAFQLTGGGFVIDTDAPDTQHFQITRRIVSTDPVVGILQPLGAIGLGLLGEPAAFVVTPGVVIHGGVEQLWRLAAVIVNLNEVGQTFAFPTAMGQAAHAAAEDGVAPAHDQLTLLGAEAVGGVVRRIGSNGYRPDGITMEVEHQPAAVVQTTVGVRVEQNKVAAGMTPGVVADHVHYL